MPKYRITLNMDVEVEVEADNQKIAQLVAEDYILDSGYFEGPVEPEILSLTSSTENVEKLNKGIWKAEEIEIVADEEFEELEKEVRAKYFPGTEYEDEE